MKLKNLFFTMVGLALLPAIALADNKPNALTFTLGGGYIFFAPKRDLKNAGIPTYTAVAYNFDEKWATEFAVDLINANSDDPTKQHIHGFIYLLDAMYRLPTYRHVDPYVLGGFNIASLKRVPNQAVNQGGMNVGIGTEFFRSNSIALSAEARDIYTFSGGKNDILLNLGINFIWE